MRQSNQFRDWNEASDHGSLWVKAVPGAGKSVLASSIISELISEGWPVLYFFFRQIIATNRSANALLRDWMAQLLPISPVLQAALKPLATEKTDLATLSRTTMWQYLRIALGSLPRVYCVADALDEMDEDDEFLKELLALGRYQPASVKVLMTSRPVPRVEAAFHNSGVLSMRLDQQHVNEDIETYVNLRVKNPIPYDLPVELKQVISDAICNRGQGLFLYARLMMDAVMAAIERDGPNRTVVEHAVAELPFDLHDMYTRMLLGHAKRLGIDQQLQVTILEWVTHSRRPLRLLELTTIVHYLANDNMPVKERKVLVRNACGPLVEILEDETLQVIHHSFTEFLVGPRIRSSPSSSNVRFPDIIHDSAHRAMAIACIRYLMSDALKEDFESNASHASRVDKYQQCALNYVFFEYAVDHWHEHLAACNDLGIECLAILDEFLAPGGASITLAMAHRYNRDQRGVQSGTKKSTDTRTTFHIASELGLTSYVAHLLPNQRISDVNVDIPDFLGNTALALAARNGHADVVALLLKGNAAPDQENTAGLKPLHSAAKRNYVDVVKLLLEAGVSPTTPKTKATPRMCGNARSDFGDTPLRYATLAGHYETVMAMLSYIPSEYLERTLCWSVQSGNEKLVKSILDNTPVSPDATYDESTAVFMAAQQGLPAMVKALLDHGANPHARSMNHSEGGVRFAHGVKPFHFTPLHGFTQRSNTSRHKNKNHNADEVITLLIKAGLDVNAVDHEGSTPLLTLSRHSNGEAATTMKVLLENGADPCVVDKHGQSVLYYCCRYCYFGTDEIEIVIAYGATINTTNLNSAKAPIFAAMDSKPPALTALLKHNVDCTVRASDTGHTIFHSLVLSQSCDWDEKLDLIISKGINLNATDYEGNTCLHIAPKSNSGGSHGSLSLLQKLISNGANLEARNHKGNTVLLHELRKQSTACNNMTDIIASLLELGANPNVCNFEGKSTLHLACQDQLWGELSILRMLIGKGANILCRDHAGNTVLHDAVVTTTRDKPGFYAFQVAVRNAQDIQLIDNLIDLGVDVKALNHQGQTVLHSICASWSSGNTSQFGVIDKLLDLFGKEGINRLDNTGRTALHYAATVSDQCVYRLLNGGADPTLVDIQGRSILHYAARARNSHAVALLVNIFKISYPEMIEIRDRYGRSALHDAIRSGKPESVEVILLAGADANSADKLQRTPLVVCSEIRKEDTVYELLSNQWSSLGLEFQDPLRPVKQLLKKYQLLSRPENDFKENCSAIIARLLIRHGAILWDYRDNQNPPNVVPNQRLDAYHEAVAEGDAALVRELRKHAAQLKPCEGHFLSMEPGLLEKHLLLRFDLAKEDVEIYFEDGGDPLAYFNRAEHKAAVYDAELITLLLERGVDFTTIMDRNGDTPLSLIARKGLVDSMTALEAQVRLFENEGSSAKANTAFNHPYLEFNRPHLEPEPLLIAACRHPVWNIAMVKLLVDEFHVDVNIRRLLKGKPAGTALHVLAQGSTWWQLEALEYLLSRGADIEALNESGETPLHVACKSWGWSSSCVAVLLRNGADVNVLDASGRSCVGKAGSNLEKIKSLIDYGADLFLGETPVIFTAIASQDVDIIEVLLKANADCSNHAQRREPNRRFPEIEIITTEYPLLKAASAITRPTQTANNLIKDKSIKIMELLLNHGADYKLCVTEGESILHKIMSNRNMIWEPLLKFPGIDLNFTTATGVTPIMAAICSGHWVNPCVVLRIEEQLGLAIQLLDKGVDITITDANGRNVFHHLLQNRIIRCTPDVFRKFLNHPSADTIICQRDAAGFTPMHYALQQPIEFQEHCQLLREKGVDIMSSDPDGNGPLHHIAKCLDQEVLPLWETCDKLGADINLTNDQGDTPLLMWLRHLKVATKDLKWCHDTLTNVLAGSDIHVRNKRGEGALHVIAAIAVERRTSPMAPGAIRDVFKLFMDLGLDPLAEDNLQKTPLDVAAVAGNVEILALFARDK